MEKNLYSVIRGTKFGLYKKLVYLDLIDQLKRETIFLDKSYIEVPISQRYWHIRNNSLKVELCACGKPAKFYYSKNKYLACSKECTALKNSDNGKLGNTDKAKRKRKRTNKERFGVDNYSKTKEFRDNVLNGKLMIDGIYISATDRMKDIIKTAKLEKGLQIPDHLLTPYQSYRKAVYNTTRKYAYQLFKEWDGYDFYDGKYIKNFKTGNKVPTIDHKISIYAGFKANMTVDSIADPSNLCITKKSHNSSKKHHLTADEYIKSLQKK